VVREPVDQRRDQRESRRAAASPCKRGLHAGLRQARASAADILAVEWVFDVLYRSGDTPYQSLPRLRARAGEPIIDDYLRFIEASPRGLCHGSGRARRGHLHDGANATASADGNEAAPGRNTLA
jgi:hypothetical protein